MVPLANISDHDLLIVLAVIVVLAVLAWLFRGRRL